MAPKPLSVYLDACRDLLVGESSDCDAVVVTVTADSRMVVPGALFVAIRGELCDGRAYVDDAVERGAVAVLYQGDDPLRCPIPSFQVVSDYAAFGRCAEAFYDWPATALTLIGVTGTNGKTTTTSLICELVRQAGQPVGLIGSLTYETGLRSVDADRTTPMAMAFQRYLAEMRDAGITTAVVEVSSHALIQQRMGSTQFDIAVFTNLSGDHLDYHGTMDNYFAAKSELFHRQLKDGGLAVVNADDQWGDQLRQMLENGTAAKRILDYGRRASAIRLNDCALAERMTRIRFDLCGRACVWESPLVGMFNAYNILAAVGVGHGLGIDGPVMQHCVRRFMGVAGRLQRVDSAGEITAFVDFAHTDDALKNVLAALRPITRGRLIVVFGCGGDRDRSKRPRMGAVAAATADVVVVTSDNPRREQPDAIVDDIMSGIPGHTECIRVTDRHDAIDWAFSHARAGDVVLVAGKGHETYQEIDGQKIPFSDVDVCREALHRHGL